MKIKIILFFVLSLGFVLRIWQVSQIPPGLNRDEAAIGYTAYSLLKTGKDEYGRFLPVSLESFGDWKLPLYIYLTVVPVALFNLSEWSVRIISIVFGTATIFLLYLFVKELFKTYRFSEILSLLSAFFLAISPWHVHFSRVSSEANLAVFFCVLSFVILLKNINSKTRLFFASIFLSLTLYTYHGNHVFTPLLFLGIFVYLLKNILNKKLLVYFIFPFLILSIYIWSQTLFSANKTKLSGLSPLSDVYQVYNNVILARKDYAEGSSGIEKIIHNKVTYLFGRVFVGYIDGFSTDFLFVRGGSNNQHNIPGFGNLYIWDAIFIPIGLYILFHRKFQYRWFLLYWILISPIGAALTKDAPHTARMAAILPIPQILIAIGVWFLIQELYGKRFSKFVISFLMLLLIINIAYFCSRYYVHFPIQEEVNWGGGYKKLVSEVNKLMPNYQEILMDRPNYSPYIYFLFYGRVDPKSFQNNVVRYSPDSEGFHHVQQIGKMHFESIGWSDELVIPNRLLISWADSTPSIASQSSTLITESVLTTLNNKYGNTFGLLPGDIVISRILDTISLKNGTKEFYLIDVNKAPYRYTDYAK